MRSRGAAMVMGCLVVLLFAVRAVAGEPVGQVVAQRGAVAAIDDGAPRALHIGAEVTATDRVHTGADGKVEIALRDGSALVLGPRSEVALARFELGEDGFVAAVVELFAGILQARTGGRVRLFEIRAPAAIASVRGTRWVVESSEEGTAVLAIEGTVEVAAAATGERVILHPGEGTDVPAGAGATVPKRWGEGRVRRVLQLTSVP